MTPTSTAIPMRWAWSKTRPITAVCRRKRATESLTPSPKDRGGDVTVTCNSTSFGTFFRPSVRRYQTWRDFRPGRGGKLSTNRRRHLDRGQRGVELGAQVLELRR